MPVSPYMMNQALAPLGVTTCAALYQNPARAVSALSGATTGQYTVTSPTFSIVTGMAVAIASASLPTVLVGLSSVFIRLVPATTNQFYCYATQANAIADTSRLVPAFSFTGTVTDRDLEFQFTTAVLLSYEASFGGYARMTANYAAGALPTSNTLTRPSTYALTNTSATSASISHVYAFISAEQIALTKLASVSTVAANNVLSLTTSFTVQSV